MLSAPTPAGPCLARLLLTLLFLCLPYLLLCRFVQPCCPVCLQVYKAKMGELDVAVKMIQKQHVNPQLTPQHALRVMQQVTTHSQPLALLLFFVNCVKGKQISGFDQEQQVCDGSTDKSLLSTLTAAAEYCCSQPVVVQRVAFDLAC